MDVYKQGQASQGERVDGGLEGSVVPTLPDGARHEAHRLKCLPRLWLPAYGRFNYYVARPPPQWVLEGLKDEMRMALPDFNHSVLVPRFLTSGFYTHDSVREGPYGR